jgi:hypothetical protein
MSLLIEPENVEAILLDDGWHECTEFAVDAYEIVECWLNGRQEKMQLLYGGKEAGFACRTDGGARLLGPMSAVKAIRETVKPQRGWDPYNPRYDNSYERKLADEQPDE